MANEEEIDLRLHLGPPGTQAPPRLTLSTLGYNFSPSAKTLVTEYLNRKIHGRYNEIPENARSLIGDLGDSDIFSLDPTQLTKKYYFGIQTNPTRHPWIREDGPRNLSTIDNPGQSTSFCFGETNVRVKRLTSVEEQQAPALAIYWITKGGAENGA